MLREKDTNQGRLELVNIEDLIPADHLLRKIQAHPNDASNNKDIHLRTGCRSDVQHPNAQ